MIVAAKFSDYDLVLPRTRRLEHLFKQEMGAQGHGLGRMVSAVSGELPLAVVQEVFWLVKLRNQVVHDGRKLTALELEMFESKADAVFQDVTDYLQKSPYHRLRQQIHDWFEACPFALDDRAKNEMAIAARRQLEQRGESATEHTSTSKAR